MMGVKASTCASRAGAGGKWEQKKALCVITLRLHLFALLEHIGLPLPYLTAIRKLYHNNQHHVLVKGQLFPSITIHSGVRQGCPLSPTLFALAIDPLLYSIETSLPSLTIRAFADDTAVVVSDYVVSIPVLGHLFYQHERILEYECDTIMK